MKNINNIKLSDNIRVLIHKPIVSNIRSIRKAKVKVNQFCENKNIKFNFNAIDLDINGAENIPDTPCIFAVNHSNSHDFPILIETVGKHFKILADVSMKDTIVNIPNQVNGVYYVDRISPEKEENEALINNIVTDLKRGMSLALFPEATWNLTESKPLLPFHWGIIDIAKRANIPIIPVVLNYSDLNSKCSAFILDKFVVSKNDSKSEKIAELEDIMATKLWDEWSKNPISTYENFDFDAHKKLFSKSLSDYKGFDVKFEADSILKTSLDIDLIKSYSDNSEYNPHIKVKK